MKPRIFRGIGALIVLVTLVVASIASGAVVTKDPTIDNKPGCHAVSATGFRNWSQRVWDPERWRRGQLPHKVIAAQRVKIRCAHQVVRKKAREQWRSDKRQFYSKRHHCRSGYLLVGRVSVFGGGLMASGHYTSEPGLALNIAPGTEGGWNNSTTQAWLGRLQKFRVTIAGNTEIIPVMDMGPAGFTQRAIDVTEGGAAKLGLSVSYFPTDSIGKAKLIPHDCF